MLVTVLGGKMKSGSGEFTIGLVVGEDEGGRDSYDWSTLVTNGGGGVIE